jgi:hypothetical protein
MAALLGAVHGATAVVLAWIAAAAWHFIAPEVHDREEQP